MRAIIDVNFSNQLAPDQITWLLCTSVRCDLLMDVVETFEHLECESHVGNRRQHYEFWNFGNREFGFGISRNLFHQCHPLMLHSLLHLPSFFQILQCSSVWFAKMNFCNLPVDVQIWLALACVCSKAQRLAHKFCARWNKWNMEHGDGESTSGFWHNSHLALGPYCTGNRTQKSERNIFLPKTFLRFERRSSLVHPCTFVFLSSSDQRPNWWTQPNVPYQKKDTKKIFKSRFLLAPIFFSMPSLHYLVKDNKRKKQKWKIKQLR